jgi:hypothetical protein
MVLDHVTAVFLDDVRCGAGAACFVSEPSPQKHCCQISGAVDAPADEEGEEHSSKGASTGVQAADPDEYSEHAIHNGVQRSGMLGFPQGQGSRSSPDGGSDVGCTPTSWSRAREENIATPPSASATPPSASRKRWRDEPASADLRYPADAEPDTLLDEPASSRHRLEPQAQSPSGVRASLHLASLGGEDDKCPVVVGKVICVWSPSDTPQESAEESAQCWQGGTVRAGTVWKRREEMAGAVLLALWDDLSERAAAPGPARRQLLQWLSCRGSESAAPRATVQRRVGGGAIGARGAGAWGPLSFRGRSLTVSEVAPLLPQAARGARRALTSGAGWGGQAMVAALRETVDREMAVELPPRGTRLAALTRRLRAMRGWGGAAVTPEAIAPPVGGGGCAGAADAARRARLRRGGVAAAEAGRGCAQS